MALLVGELYAKVTADTAGARGELEKFDQAGDKSAAKAAANARKIEASRKAEEDAAGKVRVAEAALNALRENAPTEKVVAAEERLAAARRAHDSQIQTTIRLEQEAVRLKQQEADATERAAEAVAAKGKKDEEAATKARARAVAEALATREAERGNRGALVFAGSLLGLGVAGGVAGTAVAAGLVGVPALLAGLAIATQRSSDDMVTAWSAAGSEIADGAEDITAPLRDELVLAADQVTAGFRRMRPELKAMSAEAGPSVTMLVDGVVKLATNALPGMRKSVQQSGQAVAGLNALMEHTGRGISDFFEEISEGAPAAGRSAGELGLMLETLLGFGGRIVALLANDFQGTFADARVLLDQTTGAAEGLAENGFPVLASTGSTLLGVLSSIMTVLGPMAPALGTIVGVLLSMRAGAAVFGAVGDVVGRAGDRMQTAGEKGGRAGGAMRGLGSALSFVGTYGAVAGAALIGLDAATDALFGSMDQLAGKLMAGGNAAAEARSKLQSNAEMVGFLERNTASWVGTVARTFIPTSQDVTQEIAKQRRAMTTLQRAQLDASAAAADHSFAVEKYGKDSEQASSASFFLALAQQRLKDSQYEAARATQTLVDRMQEQLSLSLLLAGNNLALRMSTTAYDQARKNLNDTLKSGTATELEIRAAKEQVESASLRVIEAAGKEASAHFANQGSVEAQTAALKAQQAKALELAATMEGPLPLALQTVIANMDNTSLSALGASRTIDGAGNAVIRLPNGKEVKISAADQASSVITGIHTKLDNLPSRKWIDVFINEIVTGSAPNQNPNNLPLPLPSPRADGGAFKANQLLKVGERGEELAVFPSDGFMFTASETRAIDQMMNRSQTAGPVAPPAGGEPYLAAGGSGRAPVHIENLHLHEIKSMPSKQWLRDVMHDIAEGVLA
ncbi:hypothetical protein [Lentzea xinjiangensis]|uniref:hypothetical protein n=1 Tax=Lentzea xinjiangensis TaxID=402600 RepID=UPI001160663D|nr:hypothetical protein [Lentzea xinjiangensis]